MTSITPSTLKVNEGDSLTTSLSGFAPGTTLFFKVSGTGINKKDFAASGVKGRVQVDANGVATISHTLRADKATEGEESFAIQVFSDKKMRNLLGQSDAVTVFDTSLKVSKRPEGGKSKKSPPQSGDSPNVQPVGDIITGVWVNDRLPNEDFQAGLFQGGRITNGRFQSSEPAVIERDQFGEKFRGILFLDNNVNRRFDDGDYQFGWYWEYEFSGDDEGKNVLFNGGASDSGTWSYQRGNSELDMFDPLLPGQKHAGPIFITEPTIF